jgi:hypothetical protein
MITDHGPRAVWAPCGQRTCRVPTSDTAEASRGDTNGLRRTSADCHSWISRCRPHDLWVAQPKRGPCPAAAPTRNVAGSPAPQCARPSRAVTVRSSTWCAGGDEQLRGTADADPGSFDELGHGSPDEAADEVVQLKISLPDVLSMQCRQPSLEGPGRSSCAGWSRRRCGMRPSRIIVGEVRQEERPRLRIVVRLPWEGGRC